MNTKRAFTHMQAMGIYVVAPAALSPGCLPTSMHEDRRAGVHEMVAVDESLGIFSHTELKRFHPNQTEFDLISQYTARPCPCLCSTTAKIKD